MTDYHPLITRAVEGLDKSTGEARRALYERARAALVTQLRAIQPPLSESDITRERLALEDAIRKVEAEAARKSRTEPRPAAPPPSPRREQPGPRPSRDDAGAPSARERLLGARPQSLAQEGIKGFRDVVGEAHDRGATAKSAQAARDDRDSYGPMPSPHIHREDEEEAAESSMHGAEAQRLAEHAGTEEYAWPSHDREGAYELDHGETHPQQVRHAAHAEAEHQRPPRSLRGMIRLAVALIVFLGVAATISWQWPHITGLYQSITQFGSKQPAPTSREATAQPKLPGRVPQEQSAGQPSGAGTPGSQAVPAVAQRVVLYEEDSNDPQGKRYVGSAIWRTETVSPGPGLPPELVVRADVTIPERRISMTWSLRRNTDQALPASHTVEIMFTLPSDFAGGGIANVPGILMKQSEQTRGTPLAGLAVKVTNGFFLIGLSAVDADVQRNLQLLKERPWFDIPIVYTNGGRAILAMEKGPPGDRAFADAFAAWQKK